MLLSQIDIDGLGRETVQAAVERLRELAPEIEVRVDSVVGGVVGSVADFADGAELVVLEHRALPKWERFITRSVAGGVAARTSAPALSVPEGWRESGGERIVTVGVDVPERSQAVVRAGAEQAKILGAKLRVMHAWNLPASYEGLVTPDEDERWQARSIGELEALIAEVPEAAGLDVLVQVVRGRPAEALAQAGADSTMLVVGRHDSLVPFGSHLGPVVRAVLREAGCPVLVVDPRA
jgi:nucleotide-binding universal stress UspA family protein